MIRHIFKIIWNERKINAWLVVEYIIIFCIMWFCCDYLYTMLRNYYGPQGFDINHVYVVNMGEKPSEKQSEELDKYALAMTFMERVKRYPDIENVAFARAAVPYADNNLMSGYKINSDSINITLRQRFVSTEFFDVLKMKVDGQIFDWTDNAAKDDVIISTFRDGKFGDPYDDKAPLIPASEVHTIHYDNEWDARKSDHKIIGRSAEIRDPYYQPTPNSIIMPLNREDVDLNQNENQIVVRVKPQADKDFVERFTKDMRRQLFIGPYFLSSVVSLRDVKNINDSRWGAKDQINSAYAITLFIVVNIFLGILGSFWFRTQSRRSELGLRIALGSSKKKVQGMVVFETIMLLVIASVISTIICLNLGEETLRSLGVPTIDKKAWGIGKEQHIINFAITFAFLAVVSVIAVWYPAKQASDTQPAEALHDE